eukprot:CCRYP_009642-RA/>CCRYP_009642-RA protein AED:0.45 eAED:0.45 QI:134/1/1/1/0/0/2/57/51
MMKRTVRWCAGKSTTIVILKLKKMTIWLSLLAPPTYDEANARRKQKRLPTF